MKFTCITNQDRLEDTEGRRSKPSFLQMTSMLAGLGYFLFCKYAGRIFAEVHTRNIVLGVYTVVMVILLGLYMRKRRDAEYSWKLWVLVIVLLQPIKTDMK